MKQGEDQHSDDISLGVIDELSKEDAESSTESTERTRRASFDAVAPLAHRETKWVFWSKGLVLIVLAIATAAVAAVTHNFTTRAEVHDFEQRFEDFANQILEVSQINADHIFQTYDAMSYTLTSYAEGIGATWPYVVFPNFESHAWQSIQQSEAAFVSITPLVTDEQRETYEDYMWNNRGWMQKSMELSNYTVPEEILVENEHKEIYHDLNNDTDYPVEDGPHLFAPVSQIAPFANFFNLVNYNGFNYTFFQNVYDGMIEADEAILSEILNLVHDYLPESFMAAPVYDKIQGPDRKIVAVVTALLPWHSYFVNLIPEGVNGLELVVENTCDQAITFKINGPEVLFLGYGDLHNSDYHYLEINRDFTAFKSIERCRYSFHVYPTKEFQEFYQTNKPRLYTIVVVLIFVVTTMVFVVYDIIVERRQTKVLTTATRSNAIVNSLFPATVRDRLMDNTERGKKAESESSGGTHQMLGRNPLFSGSITKAMEAAENGTIALSSKPIADLFPHATVLFADLVGFTAWSSIREPTQVFTLLESVYNSFDKIARKLEVFKVETIGDCYVAAAGLPEPRSDHAPVMARFARQCLVKLNEVVHKLEYNLGPGTSDLSMRFGLHSGPVTAGVLRGEKSRFQLFGDTVNVAARMESTGMKNKIQLSEETANLLVAANKGHWIRPRETTVNAKGKGEMQTYWLVFGANSTVSGAMSTSDSTDLGGLPNTDIQESAQLPAVPSSPSVVSRRERSIGWNVEVMCHLLKKIIAMRGVSNHSSKPSSSKSLSLDNANQHMTVLDEVQEIITLPNKVSAYKVDPESITIAPQVISQLRDFVETIASLYRQNPFHNFDHASHVIQSTTKLLSRVVTSDSIAMMASTDEAAQLHKYTYGITSDPLTQFACVFSALIHDVDHPGLPNSRLVQEESDLAKLYKNKSVAEQHSVDVAWELLMEPKYCDLRQCIFTSQDELKRFRQLVVNCVMATDIVDKELGALRRKRWEDAFAEKGECKDVDCAECSNRKATIVIEHLIQASDVAHTMQHWHVYIKWNERLFMEMYKAYKEGRADKDPSEGWYEGEMGFFDYYIIPLAKKLRECGVFGVSSDEYLNYAQANRHEWEGKGRELVTGYVQKYNQSIQGDSAH